MKSRNVASAFTSLLFAIIESGCATGPKFTAPKSPSAETGLVYVFRPSAPPLALKPTILVDGQQVAELTNKGYFDLDLKPGMHSFKADWSWSSGVPDGEILLEVKGGQTYYVVVNSSMHTTGLVASGITVVPVLRFEGGIGLMDETAARDLISQCGRIKLRSNARAPVLPE